MKQDMIVILDLGSTENTVIARQIRELEVYSEIHPHDIESTAKGERNHTKRRRESGCGRNGSGCGSGCL